ncbi:excalibur calcium-binding domain-containing protein [Alteromonas macleodii]|nr:excalibur calcium-binding domain-containing protein [Alteromonas macleodii]
MTRTNNGKITCAEARSHGITPVKRGHPAYEFMYDRDGDGIVCE